MKQKACIASETLTDGSVVWAVIFCDAVRLDCISEDDAIELSNKLEGAVEKHTVGGAIK